MSVGFGFSVGDFIAAIELVGTVLDAMRSSGFAVAAYREVISQLLSLEMALIQVKNLEFEECQYAEVVALRQTASQCQRTIDAFWEKTKKFQPLGNNGSSSSMKARWMKIVWGLCKKEDIATFKADLVGHTESIQLLLTAIHIKGSRTANSEQVKSRKTLAGLVQDGFFTCMQRLSEITGQCKQLLELTTTVLQTNVNVFQIVLEIQQFITRLPAQIEREQPVYLIDALGKEAPFHLSFVRSVEALKAVLAVNFEKHGGSEKIRSGQFVLQDAVMKRDIDLTADWEICFRPGQRVEMSVIVSKEQEAQDLGPGINCPRCQSECATSERPTCQGCGLQFHTLYLHWSSFHSTTALCRRNTIRHLPFHRGTIEGPKSHATVKDEISSFQHVRMQVNHEAHRQDRKDTYPYYPPRKRPSTAGWWICCQCSKEVNPAWHGDSCPDCGHEKCVYYCTTKCS